MDHQKFGVFCRGSLERAEERKGKKRKVYYISLLW